MVICSANYICQEQYQNAYTGFTTPLINYTVYMSVTQNHAVLSEKKKIVVYSTRNSQNAQLNAKILFYKHLLHYNTNFSKPMLSDKEAIKHKEAAQF